MKYVSRAVARVRGTAARTSVGWLGTLSELVTVQNSRGVEPSAVMSVQAEIAHRPVAAKAVATTWVGMSLSY